MAAASIIIDHLHVHARAPDTLGTRGGGATSLRLGLEQALRRVRPRPARLPPQAILVIRSLSSRAAFGLTSGARQRWQQQLEAQIDELARCALRPDRQHVPPGANCVLFDDEVAVLLCFTRDLLAGRWAWYWGELFPSAHTGQSDGERLLLAWQAHLQAVPHTLVDLPLAEAGAALNRLNRAEHSRLAYALHDTFALPRDALDAEAHAHAPGGAVHTGVAGTVMAPWQAWLPPDRLQGLAPAAHYVLGLSYTLVRQPQVARTPAFGSQARRWLEDATVATTPAHLDSVSPKHAQHGERVNEPEQRKTELGSLQVASTTNVPPAPVDPSTHSDRGLAPDGAPGHLPTALPDADQTATALGAGAFTRLGGAIYFVNLLTMLGLPGSIPALAGLNPWELLGGLAVALLGDRLDDYVADPLWGALDVLAGLEPGGLWGEYLPEAAAFWLPAAWLGHLPPQQLVAHQEPNSERLQVWAAAPGYLVADLPIVVGGTEWPDLVASPAARERLATMPPRSGRMLAPNLAWWVQRLRPYVGRFLARLLGQPGDVAAAFFNQPGTLYVSRTHVDLVLSVEQGNVGIRRAGLDQTPGWLPEFGYIITIHFE